MTIRVLVVDDSRFICKRVREILEEDAEFKVVGIALNGQEAVNLSLGLHPDVITMDVEMPVMDGITAVKHIMASQPRPILMLSAMTQIGAKATLDALNAGAIDFLPKKLEDIDENREAAKFLLRQRVRMVASQTRRIAEPSAIAHGAGGEAAERIRLNTPAGVPRRLDLLVIAASTGGPVAIQRVLSQIPAECKIPVLLVQHMPRNFTRNFAERLNQLCHIQVREAENGDILRGGVALLGPGGQQMQIKNMAGQKRIAIREKRSGEIYSPCIDITFTSLADEFDGRILAVVLTGMGADGKEGAIRLKRKGAEIWAQDESSSTIYGMPKAIAEANIADKVYSLDEMAYAFKGLN